MITTFLELPEIRERHSDSRIVFRKGCFDIVHEGHVEGLKFSKEQGDLLVVGVVPDKRIRERKGPTRPVRTEASRLVVVDAFQYVDYSFILPEREDPLDPSPTNGIIETLRPDVFVIQSIAAQSWLKHADEFQQQGTEIVIDDLAKCNSSTQIINQMAGNTTGLNNG